MSDLISDHKFVEVTYEILDRKTGQVLTAVEFPLGYVHGCNDILMPQVQQELEGQKAGDTIEIPIDCNQLYGPRDETLVFTDKIENVPEAYREIGTTITMENDKGDTKNFVVTRMDEETLTVDGNNPLCGRDVLFKLKVLSVRDATEEEIVEGGAIVPDVDLKGATAVPV